MKQITTEVVNTFLTGHDPMEHIISIECAFDEDKVNIIYVDQNGIKRIKQDDFKPFIWVKHSAAIRLFDGDRAKLRRELRNYGIAIKKLITENNDGTEHERLESGYKYLFYATRKMSNKIFQDFFTKAGVPIHPRQKKGETDNGNREFMGVTPIEQYMIATGRRLFKGYDTYGALVIKIRHNVNGRYIYSTYAHMSRFGAVSVGQNVSAFTQIGNMGSTGYSTGPHLHLELTSCDWNRGGGCTWAQYQRSTINPTSYVNFPSSWNNR